MRAWKWTVWAIGCATLGVGCTGKSPKNAPAAQQVRAPKSVEIDTRNTHLRYSYLAKGGTFKMARSIAEIPKESRGAVMVIDLSNRRGGGRVPVVDLSKPAADGKAHAQLVGRDVFERRARAHQDAQRPPVTMYATSWCGVCAKARQFLDEKGVKWTERDIEKDPDAARELRAKAAAAGVPAKGVPVFDVGGKLLAGFDSGALSRLLGL